MIEPMVTMARGHEVEDTNLDGGKKDRVDVERFIIQLQTIENSIPCRSGCDVDLNLRTYNLMTLLRTMVLIGYCSNGFSHFSPV